MRGYTMSISRRRFLKWAGVANLALLPGKAATAASGHHFEGYPESGGVLYDNTRCIGCRKCEKGCAEVNGFPAPDKPFDDLTVLERKRRTGNTAYTVVNRYENPQDPEHPTYRKLQCNHCLEPACAAVCFVKAFKKSPSGAVVYDASVCVGCRYCMMACPFDVPTYEYNSALAPRVMKCTLCQPRLAEGLLPGCVEICPTEALIFGRRRDLLEIARERIRNHPGTYIDHIYGEKEMGGTSWLYLSGRPYHEIDMKEDLGHKPALEFTAGAISAVPIVIGLWPAFLLGVYGMTQRTRKNEALARKAAVRKALGKAQDEHEAKLAAALDRAEKAKKRELDAAVKQALSQAATNAEKPE